MLTFHKKEIKRKKGRKEERKEGRKKGRKKGRKEGRKEGRKKERKKERKSVPGREKFCPGKLTLGKILPRKNSVPELKNVVKILSPRGLEG